MFFENKKELQALTNTLFSMPPTVFDPFVGYRWLPGFRIVRFIKGELILDNTPHINNYGYHSGYDYRPRKSSSRVFRIIALGDSFTNSLDMPLAWPEMLQNLLRSRPESGREIEVYGMPTDGGGLLNWYAAFKDLILPDFDFDALILADFHGDLARKFMIFHATHEALLMGRFPYAQRPRSHANFAKLASAMIKIFEVKRNDEIERIVAEVQAAASPASMTADDYLREHIKDGRGPDPVPDGYSFSPERFAEQFEDGPERWTMLAEIAQTCKERDVPIIYSPLPTRHGLLWFRKTKTRTLHQAQGAGLCRHLGIRYFDGYEAFNEVSPEAVANFYWLKYDGHWGLGGAHLYAVKLAEWIVAQGIIRYSGQECRS